MPYFIGKVLPYDKRQAETLRFNDNLTPDFLLGPPLGVGLHRSLHQSSEHAQILVVDTHLSH